MNRTITLTFSESVENHVGMEIIGKKCQTGFSPEKCRELAQRYSCGELYELNFPKKRLNLPEACIVVFRDGLKNIFGIDKDALLEEQSSLEWDTKAYMYGRVVNKNARYNLCYADYSREPDYENKKGRILSFDDLPITKDVRENLCLFGREFEDLYAEGNYYYDTKKCYIGYHGDSERRKVIGVRLGDEFPLHFKWYQNGEETNQKITIPLRGGDIYIMSEKATGNDWKKRGISLRHAAGIKIK